MGMDVYGKKPTTEEGKYFRNNVWWWRPLADYIIETAPDLAEKCHHWHTNDGDGLGSKDSKALASRLREQVASGQTAAYAAIREAEQTRLPDERCELCHATGKRTDDVAVTNGFLDKVITEPADHPRLGESGWCNGCDGRGRRRPADTWYSFNVANVEEFIVFLEHCGGFQIN